ncbi:hypothetical protein [Nocardia huaxiensis]|uniref:hypothetical protein n=1 Tax=Nocardia huaxiensis TaxID=2755382 RepID=UPI001E46B64D|nr:hypothetical protein [Nocardia huaxiensis]UFS97397.1 hypothetical protein LPY97_05640 [Nocardia huaxiensis]
MARDFEPPVRERDSASTRRGTRRDGSTPDAPAQPPRDAEAAASPRVVRDEHRPRRGTLPDRRLLRRDTPFEPEPTPPPMTSAERRAAEMAELERARIAARTTSARVRGTDRRSTDPDVPRNHKDGSWTTQDPNPAAPEAPETPEPQPARTFSARRRPPENLSAPARAAAEIAARESARAAEKSGPTGARGSAPATSGAARVRDESRTTPGVSASAGAREPSRTTSGRERAAESLNAPGRAAAEIAARSDARAAARTSGIPDQPSEASPTARRAAAEMAELERTRTPGRAPTAAAEGRPAELSPAARQATTATTTSTPDSAADRHATTGAVTPGVDTSADSHTADEAAPVLRRTSATPETRDGDARDAAASVRPGASEVDARVEHDSATTASVRSAADGADSPGHARRAADADVADPMRSSASRATDGDRATSPASGPEDERPHTLQESSGQPAVRAETLDSDGAVRGPEHSGSGAARQRSSGAEAHEPAAASVRSRESRTAPEPTAGGDAPSAASDTPRRSDRTAGMGETGSGAVQKASAAATTDSATGPNRPDKARPPRESGAVAADSDAPGHADRGDDRAAGPLDALRRTAAGVGDGSDDAGAGHTGSAEAAGRVGGNADRARGEAGAAAGQGDSGAAGSAPGKALARLDAGAGETRSAAAGSGSARSRDADPRSAGGRTREPGSEARGRGREQGSESSGGKRPGGPERERMRRAPGADRGEGEAMRNRRGTRERAHDAATPELEGRPARGGQERRGEDREVRRGRPQGSETRRTDADRVHLGGRTGGPERERRVRPDGDAGERPVRKRPARNPRPEVAAADVDMRKGARRGRRSKDIEATPVRKQSGKKKQSGPKLLDDATRARLEVTAREGNGIRAALATFRLHTDDLRRRNFAARAERMEYGSFDEFDRSTQQLTDRGYVGEGGGRMNVIGRPVEYRATTAQVAGLWPWSVGAGAPLIGTPLGSHLHTGAPVCFDPMNWFMRGSFITAPSLFVLGLNGFGKSSLVRRIVLGGVAQGITPLILADVKPDYRKLVELVGGQVIDLGYGHGKLNPLAAGVLGSVVPRLDDMPVLQTQVMQELRARQVTLVAGLVELVRGARVRDYEETLISTGLRILYRDGSEFTPDKPPILDDLLAVIVAGGDELQLDAGADNPDEYQNAIKGLRRSLRALTQGPFGAIFNGHTTTPIDTASTAVCIDVSHIPNGDKKLKAAVMLACWADGFASVEAAHVLADAGLGPQRYFQVVMDELWQVLGLGDFMVDRVDELTRLQRSIATALIMISHTIKDLQALGSEAAIAKALGFLERARAKIFGALPAEEIQRLDSTVPFTSAEEEMVTSWSAPQALTGEALKPGQTRPSAPGTGKFLLKIGEDRRPGIPFHMEFTLSEKESGIHDTNQRFSEFTETTARRGHGTDTGGDEGSAA